MGIKGLIKTKEPVIFLPQGRAILLTEYKLNKVCNADKTCCSQNGRGTKINYKASLAQYIVLVKHCNLHMAFQLFLRICLSIKNENLQNSTRSVPIYKAYRHGVWFHCLSVRLLYLDSPYKPFPLELYRRCGQCASARPQLNCRIAAA